MQQPGFSRAALAALAGVAFTCGAAWALEVDVRNVADANAAVARAFGDAELARLAVGESTTLRGVPVGDVRVDLELQRFDIWASDGVFFINDASHEKPAITLLRGAVVGNANSEVVLGLGRHVSNGFIATDGKTYSVSAGSYKGGAAQPQDIRITDLAGFQFDQAAIHACGVDGPDEAKLAPFGLPVPPDPAQSWDRGTPPCRVARIALDSDWEWTSERFGGNAEAAAEYALFVTAAISEIYQRDLNVRLVVPYLRTFSADVDPYNGTTSPDPLDQVRDFWRSNMGGVDRELTHLLTGANTSYGGVAYLSVMCNTDWGYGVSSYMNGSFPYPLETHSNGNWDLVVMAHELGHNFGTLHTHDGYNPPIDNCGIDCSGSHDGTIMSYCHICSGGLANIDLTFHPLVRAVIEDYLAFDAPCSLEPTAGANDDSTTTFVDSAVDLFVLGNDHGDACAPVGLASVQSPTANGGTAVVAGWDNPTGDPTGHFVRYTPAPGFTGADSFSYTTTAGQSANVAVSIVSLRAAETINNPEPGLYAAYYDIGGGHSVVPDFSGMTPVAEAYAPTINYASTTGDAVGGPLADNVGAVFEGYVRAPADGLYTFSLESDDGSLLYIGDDLVVNNDGLHGMQSASGQIALAQGDHAVRIEFFEAGGGAGLIYRWAGPGGSGVVPTSALRHAGLTCGPADIAAPFGILDLQDITDFVVGFQIHWPATDIAEPYGVWDLDDLSAFIESFLAGCE
ncbi:MAG: hypothetical protein H6810_04350 [Phycisphaeraceae bacterium]|nr:MAG: hypothetical protein H6810_04350 [Phycisphaeraceae bacterium]